MPGQARQDTGGASPFSSAQKCIEKTFLFFEHKGTRIFETTKPLIKKKLHILCFLNYQPFFDEQNRRFPSQVHIERCM